MSHNDKEARGDLPQWVEELDALRGDVPELDANTITLEFPDNSKPMTVSRREFLRVASVAAAAAGIGGAATACRAPQEKIVPYVKRPDGVYHDTPLTFSSVCDACPSQCGLHMTVREGRPTKLEGNPSFPTNKGTLCARGQGSLLDLYSPDRIFKPQKVSGGAGADTTWKDLDAAVAATLKKGGKVRLLLGTRTGPSQLGALSEFLGAFGDAKAVIWEALAPTAARKAASMIYKGVGVPRLRLDRARVVVSVGGAFLDTDGAFSENTRQYASTRNPERPASMSRLHVFESRLTLTGTAADKRTPVRPTDHVYVALALANHVVIGGAGPLSGDTAIKAALAPFTIDKVAKDLGIDAAALKAAGDDLKSAGNKGVVVTGGPGAGPNDVALNVVGMLINEALGGSGVTFETQVMSHHSGVDFDPAFKKNISSDFEGLKALSDELNAGGVDLLIVSGVNPAFSAPAKLKLKEGLGKAKQLIFVGTEFNETAAMAAFAGSGSHFLESWGDANPATGVYAIRQPGLARLHDSRSLEECLILWTAAAGVKVASFDAAIAQIATFKDHQGRTAPSAFYFYLRDYWKKNFFGPAKSLGGFDNFWDAVVREGVYYTGKDGTIAARRLFTAGRTKSPGQVLKPDFAGAIASLPKSRTAPKGLDVEIFGSITMWDGRQQSNGVLQECPDPVSQVSWGNYVAIAPKRFTEMNLELGQMIEVKTANGTLKLPAMFMPGLHNDAVAIPAGYGRTHAGVVGSAMEAVDNAYKIAEAGKDGVAYNLSGASLTATSEATFFGQAEGKGHAIDLHERHLVPLTTLAEFQKDPKAGAHTHGDGPSFWGNRDGFPEKKGITWGNDHKYEDTKWEMAIDLSRCTGCSACVVACQIENNIPVVGKTGVFEGRSMHWIRIDRYYRLPDKPDGGHYTEEMLTQNPEIAAAQYLENPEVLIEPMLCQHCDNAPCESVCPVLATVHSTDGLNEQIYNRCVGTRYCANNCPFKVRRFNWFNYGDDRSDSFFAEVFPQLKDHAHLNAKWPLPLKFNPEVTVRARGVMEKCSFCVQRLRKRTTTRRKLGIADPANTIKTACQQTCPAEAITFGNIREKDTPIAKKVELPRAFTLLAHLNVRPGVKYLTRVKNS